MADSDISPKCPPEGWTIFEAAKALSPSWNVLTQADVEKSDVDMSFPRFITGLDGKQHFDGRDVWRSVGELKRQLDELKSLIIEQGNPVTGRPGPGHSESIALTKGILQTLNFYRWRDNIARDEYGALYRDIRIYSQDRDPILENLQRGGPGRPGNLGEFAVAEYHRKSAAGEFDNSPNGDRMSLRAIGLLLSTAVNAKFTGTGKKIKPRSCENLIRAFERDRRDSTK